MPSIGHRCHELRVNDADQTWRVIYRTDNDAIVLIAVFAKQTREAPTQVIHEAKKLLARYDQE